MMRKRGMFGRSYRWKIEGGGGVGGRKPGEATRKMGGGGRVWQEVERKLPFIKRHGFPHMLVS